jgi:hypothetical protein
MKRYWILASFPLFGLCWLLWAVDAPFVQWFLVLGFWIGSAVPGTRMSGTASPQAHVRTRPSRLKPLVVMAALLDFSFWSKLLHQGDAPRLRAAVFTGGKLEPSSSGAPNQMIEAEENPTRSDKASEAENTGLTERMGEAGSEPAEVVAQKTSDAPPSGREEATRATGGLGTDSGALPADGSTVTSLSPRDARRIPVTPWEYLLPMGTEQAPGEPN